MSSFKIDFVDVYEGGMGHTVVEADSREEAEAKFEEQSDGCAIVIIKEVKDV